MPNNPLQAETITPPAPSHKDVQAFAQGEGPCYWMSEKSFTRTDFLQVANGEVAIAEQLFSLIDGLSPQETLYKLVNEGALQVANYINDGERTALSFGGPPLPTKAQRRLLEAQGWQALFPELTHPHLWTKPVPGIPVPHGIAFTDLVKRSEFEVQESLEEGHDHE